MNTEQTLMTALHADPSDLACWLALADCLEEGGQQRRAELLRLRLGLQDAIVQRFEREGRLRQLLDEGTRPVVPTLTNSIGTSLALIPAGAFWMGSLQGEAGRHADEDPRHQVRLTRAFYLGVYPVTQAEYLRVMGINPSHFRIGGEGAPLVRGMDTSSFPVERVSWHDAVAFCHELSQLPEERSAGRVYRLPSEAEWEYACRAGTTTMFSVGDALGPERANVEGILGAVGVPVQADALTRTCAVGSYAPNAFGLHDMHGNVWEWCSDWFDADYYRVSPVADPQGPATGVRRAMRGGGWFHHAMFSRSAYRYRYEPEARHNDFGLRVALTAS